MKLSIVNKSTNKKKTFIDFGDFQDISNIMWENSNEYPLTEWCYLLEKKNINLVYDPEECDWVKFDGTYFFEQEEEQTSDESSINGLYPWDNGYIEAYEEKFGESYVK